LIYLNPRPTFTALSRYYPGEYNRPVKELLSGKRLGARIFRHLAVAVVRLQLRAVARVRPLGQRAQVLDVGCGYGAFLYALRRARGIDGIGVELSPETAAFGRTQLGLDVRTGTLLDQHFADGTFDVVTMFQYFEHEMSPLAVLRETRRILKEDGVLVLELPNAGSALFKVFKSCWFALDVPRHVIHYSRRTLAQMLEQGGFEVGAVTYFPVPFTLPPSLAYLLGLSLSRARPLLDLLLLPVTLAGILALTCVREASDGMRIYARPAALKT
jgi:SAM-dependent methyltransferase